VTVIWDDVNARARGLASRLLSSEQLAALRAAADLQHLSRALAEAGALSEEIPNATAAAIELGLRRSVARELGIARRWLGERDDVVAVALELDDRRSLRALLRGAAAGSRAEARLAGLMPTAALPERLLAELAERSTIRDQAMLLVAAGHPYGPAILAAAGTAQPSLFAIEMAIARTFAARATRGARRGGRFFGRYVTDLIDLENCRTALLLAGRTSDEPPAIAFLAGGRRLTAARFERAATSGSPDEAARLLGAELPPEVAALLIRKADDPAGLEAGIESHLGATLRREARLDPLGPAPFLLFCHRLRAQMAAVSEIVWRLELGAPPASAGSAEGAAVQDVS
jgi:vacuolar-type H+-ATPase subunit C/Vma6